MNELENRVKDLERQLAEIIDLKGIPGRPGVPGNITAACENTARVLDEKLASLFDRVELYAKRESDYSKERGESLRRELDQFREQMKQAFSAFEDGIQNRVENSIVVLFEEYGVVSSHDGRVIQA
jgi:ElaB/YqjD/DUF883 family membrane-anchored ribosome-binding protein